MECLRGDCGLCKWGCVAFEEMKRRQVVPVTEEEDEAFEAMVQDRQDLTDKPQEFGAIVEDVLFYAGVVLTQKHKDYGPQNISRSPGGPLNGLRVRMHDKLARINNLIDSGAEPENESLYDSFLDLLCYSAIGMMVLDGDWPDE